MFPQLPKFLLTSHVPDVELDVLVLDGLDVEADGGDGLLGFVELQLHKDGGLAGGVEADHEDGGVLALEHALEPADDVSHCFCGVSNRREAHQRNRRKELLLCCVDLSEWRSLVLREMSR